MVSLQDSPGVLLDKKTTAGLASLNITTVGELLRYPPRRYMQQGISFVAVGSDLGVFRAGTQALRDKYLGV